jgi:predicted SprT family Zn-dependent metalloprotease
MAKNDPTETNLAFEWFNDQLFGGKLPSCIITFQRHKGAYGYYWHDKFQKRRGAVAVEEMRPEIALNPDGFPKRKDQDVMSTLVHEMVHLWQAYYGKPGRGPYHNRQWAKKMIEVGLEPSSTGRPGGDKTGDRMSHYVIRGGAFSEAWGKLYRTGFRIRWQSVRSREKDRSKQKFSCPSCGINAWGAESLEGCLSCVGCDKILIRADR